ncbi:MAG: outer membrane beta-barrel protein, partial [Deltaproteobacteria bacterium]|nr:outer membrane beta-barrel protein [Deltaproteobacteria bacterium]
NAAPLVGGGSLPQSSQDATVSDVALRVSYEIAPDYLGYVRLDGALYDYWHTAPGETFRPNSKTYRADFGLQILPRHIVYGQVYTGYLVQTFDQSSLGSTSTPDYGGRLVWNVTPLTTLTFNGLRTFITGSFANPVTGVSGPAGNGYLASTVQAVADHELFRNLLLNANFIYENDSFQGITRTDNVYTASGGVRYLVNRHLFLGGNVTFQERTSTLPGNSYTQYVVMGRIGTQF